MLTPCHLPTLPRRFSPSAAMCRSQLPQPGEIWQLDPQRSLLPEAIGSGQSTAPDFGTSRYILVIQEPQPLHPADPQWQIISAMLLSDRCQNASAVDLLMTAEITGLNQLLLAETWHLLSVLTCNLTGAVGQRLSRRVYDLLLTVGDCYYTPDRSLPEKAELHAAGLFPGRGEAHPQKLSQETLEFHQQEQKWSHFFNRQIAACRVAIQQQQMTQRLLHEALQVEQMLDRPSPNSQTTHPLEDTPQPG